MIVSVYYDCLLLILKLKKCAHQIYPLSVVNFYLLSMDRQVIRIMWVKSKTLVGTINKSINLSNSVAAMHNHSLIN